LDWRDCVAAFTEKHLERIAEWRGYSIEFCSWLKEKELIGLYDGCIAFPVHNRPTGDVTAVQYRLEDGSWRYYPLGTKVRPLMIGELVAGEPVHVCESTWDGLDIRNKGGEGCGTIVITRGAGNGALTSEIIPDGSTVYLWPQNDSAGDKWQADILRQHKENREAGESSRAA
jgi:hypothetical protein